MTIFSCLLSKVHDNRNRCWMLDYMKSTFKELRPTNCILQDTRIDVWQYPLHTEFVEASSLLSEDESIRAKRYYFSRHQRRFTVARAVMRIILARYLQLPPTELVFTYNQYGKPQLINDLSLQFNLSHSGDLALLAIGKTHPLGIDLEFFSARPYEGIAEHLFSSVEMQALHDAELALKPLIFFHIWAQKEALIKACGLGLSYPTKQFDVPILPGSNQEIVDLLHKKNWKMTSFMPQIACNAALCYHPFINEIHFLKLTNLTTQPFTHFITECNP